MEKESFFSILLRKVQDKKHRADQEAFSRAEKLNEKIANEERTLYLAAVPFLLKSQVREFMLNRLRNVWSFTPNTTDAVQILSHGFFAEIKNKAGAILIQVREYMKDKQVLLTEVFMKKFFQIFKQQMSFLKQEGKKWLSTLERFKENPKKTEDFIKKIEKEVGSFKETAQNQANYFKKKEKEFLAQREYVKQRLETDQELNDGLYQISQAQLKMSTLGLYEQGRLSLDHLKGGYKDTSHEGYYLLHAACRLGDKRGIQAMLARGSDPYQKDAAGLTALDYMKDHGFSLDQFKEYRPKGCWNALFNRVKKERAGNQRIVSPMIS